MAFTEADVLAFRTNELQQNGDAFRAFEGLECLLFGWSSRELLHFLAAKVAATSAWLQSQ